MSVGGGGDGGYSVGGVVASVGERTPELVTRCPDTLTSYATL